MFIALEWKHYIPCTRMLPDPVYLTAIFRTHYAFNGNHHPTLTPNIRKLSTFSSCSSSFCLHPSLLISVAHDPSVLHFLASKPSNLIYWYNIKWNILSEILINYDALYRCEVMVYCDIIMICCYTRNKKKCKMSH